LAIFISIHPSDDTVVALVAHKYQINCLNLDKKFEPVSQDSILVKDPNYKPSEARALTVIQAAYCPLVGHANPFLVVATNAGILIYDFRGTNILLWQQFEKLKSPPDSRYAKGVTYTGEFICVGCYTGHIYVFNALKDGSVKLRTAMREHASPITDLVSDHENLVASISADGTIITWDGTLKLLNKNSTSQPLICAAARFPIVFCGSACGQIFAYHAKSGEFLCEISAHARPVNAMDISSDGKLMLSVSDDSFLRIWALDKLDPLEIDCQQSECVLNVPLVGGRFLPGDSNVLMVTGYDYPIVYYYKRKVANILQTSK